MLFNRTVRSRVRLSQLAGILLLALLLSACSGAPGAGQNPIKIGAISSLTGPVTFPDASAAAKAVFDRVNAQGGINGRPIEYLVEDDKFDPATATQAARRLLDEQNVVVMAGSASFPDCAANNAYYQQKNVLVIPGAAISADCYNSPNIAPTNAGAINGMILGLYFASNTLKHSNVCAVLAEAPGAEPVYAMVAERWKALSGLDPLVFDTTFKQTDDPTPFILKTSQAGCEAVLFNGIDQQAIAWVRSAAAQQISGIDWIFLSPAYSAAVAETLGAAGEGIYALSEYEPFSGDAESLNDWRSLMNEAKVPLSGQAQGGYLAATIIVDTLKGIQGEITRESVTAALHNLEAYTNPLIGSPYRFGNAERHNPVQSGKFVQLTGGQWQVVTPEFVALP
jgi:branched-chain amino acid transport system substrate-binding protein